MYQFKEHGMGVGHVELNGEVITKFVAKGPAKKACAALSKKNIVYTDPRDIAAQAATVEAAERFLKANALK